MKSAGLTFKLKKCFLFNDSIEYLGHNISPGTLEVAKEKTDAILGFRLPTNISKLRSLLCLCSLFRQFVPDFLRLAATLNTQLSQGEPMSFELDKAELAVIEELKRKVDHSSDLSPT